MIGFSPHCETFFSCFFCILGRFLNWIRDTVNFALLGPGFLSLNYFWFYFKIQWRFLELVWSFLRLAFKFIGKYQSSLQFGVILALLQRWFSEFWILKLEPQDAQGFSFLAVGIICDLFLFPSLGLFPHKQGLIGSHFHARRKTRQNSVVLSVKLSSLCYCALWLLSPCGFFKLSTLPPQLKWIASLAFSFLSLQLSLETWGSKLFILRIIWWPSLRSYCLVLPVFQHLLVVSHILFVF